MTSIGSNHTEAKDVIVSLDDLVKLVIVDDHRLFANLLESSLQQPGQQVTAVFDGSEPDLYEAVVSHSPDLVLLDLHLDAGGTTSVPLLARLTRAGVRTLVVTGSEDRIEQAECIEAGAIGIVEKSGSVECLRRTVSDALANRTVLDENERISLMIDLRIERDHERHEMAPFQRLTPREKEVLAMMCDGRTAAEIAEAGFVSLATVRSQIRSILAKLNVSSQLAAVGLARRSRWLEDGRR